MHNLIMVCTHSMVLFNSSTVCAESHNLEAIAKSVVNVLLPWRLLQSCWKQLSAEESGVIHSGYNKTHSPTWLVLTGGLLLPLSVKQAGNQPQSLRKQQA